MRAHIARHPNAIFEGKKEIDKNMSRAVMFAHMARSSRCSHKTIVNFHCADSLVRFRNRYVERVTLQVPIHGKGQTDSVRL